jgi:hypothetical protein
MFREPRSLPDPRVESLAARVRWLDRYRRMLAIASAVLTAPVVMAELAEGLGTDWPEMHATVLSLMLGVVVWWIFEIGLVYVTALWETEHARLVREYGLPRAVALKPRT